MTRFGPDSQVPWVANLLGEPFNQTTGIDAKGRSDLEQVHHRQVHLAALNVAEVGPVEPGNFGQFLLAQSPAKPLCPYTVPELLKLGHTAPGSLHHPSA